MTPKQMVKRMAKTWELSGAALDYAVAIAIDPKARFGPPSMFQKFFWVYMPAQDKSFNMWPAKNLEWDSEHDRAPYYPFWHPSQNRQGGEHGDAIIDREKISTLVHHSGVWLAYLGFNHNDDRKFMTSGSTRREAAMRCWARSKLGDEIDIPKEIMNG